MIRDAEENADEDKKIKERIDAKNAFDGYIHGLKSAVEGILVDERTYSVSRKAWSSFFEAKRVVDAVPELVNPAIYPRGFLGVKCNFKQSNGGRFASTKESRPFKNMFQN